MSEDLVLNDDCKKKGIFGGCGEDIDDSLLFFFLILVLLFTNCNMFDGCMDDSLLFFFLILVLIFCNCGDIF